MRTRCPECQTVFRVTPEQLKARAGKVRCGHCQSVFNALDTLLEDQSAATAPALTPAQATIVDFPPEESSLTAEPALIPEMEQPASQAEPETHEADGNEALPEEEQAHDTSATQEIGKAAGLILPRDTTEIPGYSKWAEGVMAAPVAAPVEKSSRWPFALAAVLLALGLAGQASFHYRSELAVAFPGLQPLLLTFSQALDKPLPLPARAELVSIETSDLQTDTARGNLLVLNATLRNRAPYAQAYPSLELSLTDTQDVAIARRVFAPKEYLPAKQSSDQVFPANSDIPVRLWIEAKDISAAGYRLYIFYP
ncbi:MAG: DUF3426 domain-containing protein [Propionivibrio sp.]